MIFAVCMKRAGAKGVVSRADEKMHQRSKGLE